MKKKRLFVYSVDALVHEDLAYLRTRKHFSKFLEHASGCKDVQTIYPSVTYPVHVSIQTGCYPDRNGIFCNNLFDTGGTGEDWCWDSRLIRCETIFSAAKKAGYITGAVSWPVTAYNQDIDYLLPEYWLAHREDTFEGTFLEMGTNPEIIPLMQKHSVHLAPDFRDTAKGTFNSEPEFDTFMIHVAADVIRKYQPEVFFFHGSLVDTMRHQNGIFAPEVREALDQTDAWLGMMEDAFREAGVYDDTNFVVLSDHGQMNAARIVKPNAYLAERGLIQLNEQGEVTDYVAYGISNGMSMTFWLKDPSDQAAYDRVYQVLRELAEDGVWGFDRVFTRQEAARQFHLDGDFAFIVESDGYTAFADGCVRPLVSHLKLKDHRMGRATHGYLPDRGPQPVFLAKGPDILPDIWVPRRPIVDVSVTLAKLLGVELKDAQGKAMDALLRE